MSALLGATPPSSHPEQFNNLGAATLNIMTLLKIEKSEMSLGLPFQGDGTMVMFLE